MTTINIILIVLSSMIIAYSITNIIYKCTICIAKVSQKSIIELNLTFPALLLTISIGTLLLNCLL